MMHTRYDKYREACDPYDRFHNEELNRKMVDFEKKNCFGIWFWKSRSRRRIAVG